MVSRKLHQNWQEMYRYIPPKASVWGHSLRNMKPSREKALMDRFFEIAVAQYSFSSGSVFYQPSMDTLFNEEPARLCRKHFEGILDVESSPHSLVNLGKEQFDLCLNELIRNDSLYISGSSGAVLMSGVEISKWRIKGEESPTKSHMNIFYGAKPRISTFLAFRDLEEFNFINQVLEELGICRLNEKHLKTKKK
jgi:hypothetical protein